MIGIETRAPLQPIVDALQATFGHLLAPYQYQIALTKTDIRGTPPRDRVTEMDIPQRPLPRPPRFLGLAETQPIVHHAWNSAPVASRQEAAVSEAVTLLKTHQAQTERALQGINERLTSQEAEQARQARQQKRQDTTLEILAKAQQEIATMQQTMMTTQNQLLQSLARQKLGDGENLDGGDDPMDQEDAHVPTSSNKRERRGPK